MDNTYYPYHGIGRVLQMSGLWKKDGDGDSSEY
jgi:hypothetical protein